jgi:hypothetical protein
MTLAAAPAAPSPAPKVATLSAPRINPWILGGTVVTLGAILIFLF